MKLWKRKKFVPESECVPAFVFKGEELVEVGFTEFTSQPDGTWRLSKGTEMGLGQEADLIIFETPAGCLESRVALHAGTFEIFPGGAENPDGEARDELEIGLCHRTLAARERLEKEATQDA